MPLLRIWFYSFPRVSPFISHMLEFKATTGITIQWTFVRSYSYNNFFSNLKIAITCSVTICISWSTSDWCCDKSEYLCPFAVVVSTGGNRQRLLRIGCWAHSCNPATVKGVATAPAIGGCGINGKAFRLRCSFRSMVTSLWTQNAFKVLYFHSTNVEKINYVIPRKTYLSTATDTLLPAFLNKLKASLWLKSLES